jgi:DNA gyrase subunit A
MIRLSAMELPALPPTNGAPSLSAGAPLAAFVDLPRDEHPLTLMSLSPDSAGLAVGTAQGVVKRVTPDYPGNKDDWEIIGLRERDYVVGAVELRTGDEDLTFVTSDAQLLHFPASSVRPQGRTAGGMSGIKLTSGARVVFFGAVDPQAPNLVVTSSGSSGALPGTEPGSLKVTPYAEYPAKGRATGGVRCHRFLRGEDTLVLGWVGGSPARAAAANGVALDLPEASGRRDGSGLPTATIIAAIAGPLPEPRDLPSVPAHSPSPSLDDAPSDGPEMLPEFPAGRS